MKPNQSYGGTDVHFFHRENVAEQEAIFWTLLRDGHDVVLQERITPPLVRRGDHWLDWNLRVFVSRDRTGQPIAGEMLASIGEQGRPINISQGAEALLLEELAGPLGWSSTTVREIRDLARRETEHAYLAIARAISEDDRAAADGSWPDILGSDIIVRQHAGTWQAFVIEMNVNPGCAWDLNHRLSLVAKSLTTERQTEGLLSRQALAERIGGANRDWIPWMLQRASLPLAGPNLDAS